MIILYKVLGEVEKCSILHSESVLFFTLILYTAYVIDLATDFIDIYIIHCYGFANLCNLFFNIHLILTILLLCLVVYATRCR